MTGTDRYAHDERVAICAESGIAPERAERIAACEARGGECSCGAGHQPRSAEVKSGR